MKLIELELTKIFSEIREGLQDPLEGDALLDFVLSGSKFIRSTITLLYLKTFDCNISDEVYKILASGEIIHNASLLHDDVLDDAPTRRKKPSLAIRFSPKLSILAGDYLLSYAIEKLLSIKNEKILQLFKDCTKDMAEAEIKQFFSRGKILPVDDYLDICRKKTAKLFSVILESVSFYTNMDSISAAKFGELYGICFQLKNDLDTESAKIDKQNEIYTIRDILGIEKTNLLLDNYKEEMRNLIKNFPNNIYKTGLEDLINSL